MRILALVILLLVSIPAFAQEAPLVFVQHTDQRACALLASFLSVAAVCQQNVAVFISGPTETVAYRITLTYKDREGNPRATTPRYAETIEGRAWAFYRLADVTEVAALVEQVVISGKSVLASPPGR